MIPIPGDPPVAATPPLSPGTEPPASLPATGDTGTGGGGTRPGLAPEAPCRRAPAYPDTRAGAARVPVPPVSGTLAPSSPQASVPGPASGTREGPGGGGKAAAGTTPAQDPPRVLPDETPASGPGTRGGSTRVNPVAAAMSEDRGPDSLDAHVRRLMKDLGLWGFHVERSADTEDKRTNVSRKGWPDWTILGPGGGLFRELKAQQGVPTPEQLHVGGLLTQAGFNWDVWRPSDLLSGRIVRELAAISAIRRRPGGDAA